MSVQCRSHTATATVIGLVSFLAACAGDVPQSATVDSAAGALPRKDAESLAVAVAPAGSPRTWTVTIQGLGGVVPGMNMTQTAAALGGTFAGADTTIGCHETVMPGAPGKIGIMMIDGRVGALFTADTAIRTDLGARVGDTEAHIDSLYAGRLSVQPHKYLAQGHYMVVLPNSPVDSLRRIIFETNGSRVTELRTGILPAVAYTEHCK